MPRSSPRWLRHGLWVTSLVVGYGTLIALLGGAYLLLVQLLRLSVQLVLPRPNDTLVSFVATLCVALAFHPLRRPVQRWIDRAFYRDKVDYEALLPEMSDRLTTSVTLDQLSALLTQELPERLQIAWTELSVLNPAGTEVTPVHAGRLPSLPISHPAIQYLKSRAQPLLRFELPPDVPAEAVCLIEKHDIALAIPLIVGDELVGWVALGPTLAGNPYSRHHVRLLRTLGQQAAVSVQNARLCRKIEGHSQALEGQVQQRTHELQSAYRDLAQQHAALSIVLDTIADGLVVIDLEGKIILLNHVFAEMVTQHADQDQGTLDAADGQAGLVGQPHSQVWPDATLADAVAQAMRFPSTAITVDATWNERIYRALACALSAPDHSVSGAVTVLREVTQEVEMARIKDDFVSMVSHELRTPLTSIIGFTRLIHRSFRNKLLPLIDPDSAQGQQVTQRVLNNLEIIMGQGDRLTRLINNILDLSRMEAGRMQWETKRIEISAVLASSVAANGSLASEKGLEIETDIDDDLPPLYGDTDRLIQVLTNLLSNAIKFTDRDQIRIRAWRLDPGDDIEAFSTRQPNANLRLPAKERCIAVSVQDAGTGIADADLPHVFERFRQVGDEANGTRRPGTGLGLPICKEIVEYHGGQIWVESQLGIGSRFVFTLCTVDSLALF